MSLVKSEIKCATIHEMGALAEDSMEQAKRDYHLAQGASVGLAQAVKKIEGLGKHVDQDLDDGKLEVSSSLEVAKFIKKYLQRAAAIVQSDAISYEQRMLMAQGAAKAFEKYVSTTKKLHELESQKVEMIRHAASNNESLTTVVRTRRDNGAHPGLSVKQRRLIEEQHSLTGETPSKPKIKMRKTRADAKDS